jgi:ABC-type phosphate transport system substrate-binding protein
MRSTGRKTGYSVALAAAAMLVAAVAGCGVLGGSSSSGDAATTPPDTATPTASTAPVVARSSTPAGPRAKDFLLTAGSGFTGFTATSSGGGSGSGTSPLAKLASCLGATGAAVRDGSTDRAESAHLVNRTTGVTIWSDAQIVPAGQLDRDTGLLRDPNFTDCVTSQTKKDAVAAQAAAGTALIDPEATTRDVPLPTGALARTSVVVLGGSSSGGQTQLFYDTVYLGSGQVEAQLHLVGTMDPPSEDLIGVAVRQLQAELG